LRHLHGGAALGPVASVAARGTTVATIAIAAIATLAVVIALAQLRGRAFFQLVHAEGQNAQDVFVQPLLTLHFRDRGRRGVDVEQREMRLAVLVDAVGEDLTPQYSTLPTVPPSDVMMFLNCAVRASACWGEIS